MSVNVAISHKWSFVLWSFSDVLLFELMADQIHFTHAIEQQQ